MTLYEGKQKLLTISDVSLFTALYTQPQVPSPISSKRVYLEGNWKKIELMYGSELSEHSHIAHIQMSIGQKFTFPFFGSQNLECQI